MPLIPIQDNSQYRIRPLPNGVFKAGNLYLSSILCGTITKFYGIYNMPQEAHDAAKNKCCKNKSFERITYSGI